MVLLFVALVAFIAYLRASEASPGAATAGGRTPLAQILPSFADSVGLLKRGLAAGLAFGLVCARHPGVTAARGALAEGVAKLAEYVRSRARKSNGDARTSDNRVDRPALAAQALPDPGPPPPILSFAEEHGLDAVRAALGPPKQEGLLTRDQAKRLLDHLEGRL
jgi:hypothetical protein